MTRHDLIATIRNLPPRSHKRTPLEMILRDMTRDELTNELYDLDKSDVSRDLLWFGVLATFAVSLAVAGMAGAIMVMGAAQ